MTTSDRSSIPHSTASSAVETSQFKAADCSNDSMRYKNRNPNIPALAFGSRTTDPLASGAESCFQSQNQRSAGTGALAKRAYESLARSEADLTDLSTELYDATGADGNNMRILRKKKNEQLKLSRIPAYCPFAAERYEQDLIEAGAHTREMTDFYLAFGASVGGRREGTLTTKRRHLETIFSLELCPDFVLGRVRAYTAPELLNREGGKLLVLHLNEALAEAGVGDVAIDMLKTLRHFGRFIENGGGQLESGVNVHRRWGRLISPLDDDDIRRREAERLPWVPDYEDMPLIYEASNDWILTRRRKAVGVRTVSLATAGFSCGARGFELCRSSVEDHKYNPRTGELLPWLSIRNAKIQGRRRAALEPYGCEYLNYWLGSWRPRFTDLERGPLFLSERGKRLARASLTETTQELFEHLIGKKLLPEGFRFHGTRKTFATQYMLRTDNDVVGMMHQCGWLSTSQLPVYLRASDPAIARRQSAWARTLGFVGVAA